MAKKKIRKQKTTVAQHNPRHGAALGVPQAVADAFMVLYNANKLPRAQQAGQQMVDRYPESAFAWKALGTAFLEAGDAQEALAPLQKSHELDATDVQTLTSLAAAHYRQGNEQKALSYQTKAVNLQPAYGAAQFRLAEMLESSGQTFVALEHAQKALALDYDELSSQLLISSLQYQCKYFNEALKSYHELEVHYPDNPTVLNNLGNLHKDIGEYEKAELYYQRALNKNPGFATAYSNAFFAKHYNPSTTQKEVIDFAKEWEKHFSFQPLRSVEIKKNKGKPLRIGLISSGFRTHPVGQMIASALERSRSDILFYAYPTNDVNDLITQKIREACTQWKQIRHLSQEETAEQIRSDQIDILIDLSGHGDGSCLQAISMRPAPLCIKWVGGLVNTMGLESIDYLLTDSIETPDGVDDQYTEKLIRLPDDYICYVPPPYAPSITSLPAIKNRHITLGCLNNPAKISTELLSEWAMLMHQLTDSRLLLRGIQYESEDFCRRIWEEMSQHGIDESRVILEGPAKHREFLETYQRIDIALDTWPYSGGLTTCESLLMGVPVVTLPGPMFAGRHSASHLVNAGLPELVTNSWDEYRQRVVELANDLPNLAVIRAGLRTILKYSPVCDAPRFANHFNNALRAIWARYCDDKAPEALTFNKEGEMWFADEDKLVELPVVLMEETVEDKERPFEWKLDEPIIIVDNAAILPRYSEYPKWMASGHLAVISFDPASLLNKKIDKLKEYGELHHYPHALLGDGQPATLYATLDAEKGSTLKPLPEEQQPEYAREKFKVLAELSINTVSLDSIEGLPSVDMLVLDDLHDAMKVLENGKQTLQNTLLIQVRIAFQPTHENSPSLAELQHWASRNGFRFYNFSELTYCSQLPDRLDPLNRYGTELKTASALFLPNNERIALLSKNKALKFAYLLSEHFNIYDFTFKLLHAFDESLALSYSNNIRKKDANAVDISSLLIPNIDDFPINRREVELKRFLDDFDDSLNDDLKINEYFRRSVRMLAEDDSNLLAFYVLTKCLQKGIVNYVEFLNPEVKSRLEAIGWQDKLNLFGYWVKGVIETSKEKVDSPDVSVIVVARTVDKNVFNNIKELSRQTVNGELVFITHASEGLEKLNHYVDKVVQINGNAGASHARNIGAALANAPIILFVDDDGYPHENYVASHIAAHLNYDIHSVRGACAQFSGKAPPPHYNLGQQVVTSPVNLEGNASYNKEVFFEMGGWADWVMYGHEGLELSYRMLLKFNAPHKQIYSPSPLLYHEYIKTPSLGTVKKNKQYLSLLLISANAPCFQEIVADGFKSSKSPIKKINNDRKNKIKFKRMGK